MSDALRLPAETVYAAEFHALGLLASQMAAQQTLQRLTAAGLLQADPRLDMLRLNAALDDNGETS